MQIQIIIDLVWKLSSHKLKSNKPNIDILFNCPVRKTN